MSILQSKKKNESDSAALMMEVSVKKLLDEEAGEKNGSTPEWLQHWEVTPKSSIEFHPLFKAT